MTVKYSLPVPVFHLWPKLTHPVTRSFCDSLTFCTDRSHSIAFYHSFYILPSRLLGNSSVDGKYFKYVFQMH